MSSPAPTHSWLPPVLISPSSFLSLSSGNKSMATVYPYPHPGHTHTHTQHSIESAACFRSKQSLCSYIIPYREDWWELNGQAWEQRARYRASISTGRAKTLEHLAPNWEYLPEHVYCARSVLAQHFILARLHKHTQFLWALCHLKARAPQLEPSLTTRLQTNRTVP